MIYHRNHHSKSTTYRSCGSASTNAAPLSDKNARSIRQTPFPNREKHLEVTQSTSFSLLPAAHRSSSTGRASRRAPTTRGWSTSAWSRTRTCSSRRRFCRNSPDSLGPRRAAAGRPDQVDQVWKAWRQVWCIPLHGLRQFITLHMGTQSTHKHKTHQS